MLLTDTNILQRICLGKARTHLNALCKRGVRLGTTEHNAFELHRNLIGLGMSGDVALHEVTDTLGAFEVVAPDEYVHLANEADARLRQGGKSDWPLLAAALALGASIWSEDRDFFGTGMVVWTTYNTRFYQQD